VKREDGDEGLEAHMKGRIAEKGTALIPGHGADVWLT
jgi:hypothetical protein